MGSKKSNIIILQDGLYEYPLPSLPKETDILYHDLPKKDQYWRSPVDLKKQLDIKDVKRMTERDRMAYINMWRERWTYGMWFMNNGEPTYINGTHVDHLVFNEFGSRKLRYLNSQRERFYFREITNNDTTCDGRCWIKPRRAGLTTEEITEAIRMALSDFGNNVVYQSDTLYKATSTLMKPTIDTYCRRASWMREIFYSPNSKRPVKSLELRSNVLEESDNYSLGSLIEALPNVASAADGKDAVLFVIDEFSKHETTDPYEMLEINMRAANPFKPLKVDALSTTGDSKDAAKATMSWHKLIANSNPLKKNKNGKTVSGLWKYFVNATDSMYLLKEMPDIVDNYGYVDKARAEEWIWNEHKKYPEGTKERIFSMYKFPLKEEHALLSASISNLFNKPRISARLTDLESLLPDEKPYIRGRLDEDQDGKITFVSDPTGYWLWAAQPYFSIEKNIDLRNRFRRSQEGVFWPSANVEIIIGYDPINYPKGQTKSSNISQAAAFIRKKFDYFNTGIVDEVMAFMLCRPDDPHDANKEVMKAARYTGGLVMHERSIPHVYEDFRDYNMLPFLMKGEDGLYGTLANPKNLKDGISMLQARYSLPKSEDQKDHIACHPFEDCLRSLDNFDPANTTQFDPTMAEIQCEHGLKQLKYTNQVDHDIHDAMKLFNELIAPRN